MEKLSGWLRPLGLGWGSNPGAAKLEREQKLLRALDSVCRVALAVFSLMIDSSLFLTSFYAGVALSVGYVLFTRGGDQLSGNLRPFCGQGYMEFLSGKVFPQWAVRIVTTSFIAAHVRHDPQFFVPFSGLFIGWWAGAEVGTLAWSYGRKILAYQAPAAGASANCGCH